MTTDTPDGRADVPTDLTVAFTPRQVSGYVLIAAIVVALVRWLRRPRGKV